MESSSQPTPSHSDQGDQVAVDAHLESVCIEDDIEWNQLVAPAPTGIAGLGQLLICAFRVTDFRIDKIDKTHTPLIKHPSSFRTTLVQIVNDAYNAFMKAHTNMEKIQLQMAQVPNYVKDCIKYMTSGKQVVLEKLLPKRLERMKEASKAGQELSEEVSEAFQLLVDLIQQVIQQVIPEAILTDDEVAKRQGILTAFHMAAIAEKRKHEDEGTERRNKYLERRTEGALKSVNKVQMSLTEKLTLSPTFPSLFPLLLSPPDPFHNKPSFLFCPETPGKSIAKLLEKNTKRAEKEMQQFNNDYTESFEHLEINATNDFSRPSAETILKDVKELLVVVKDFQKNWSRMTLYFQSINSYIKKVMIKLQDMFVGDANNPKAHAFLSDMLTNSIKMLLESYIRSLRAVNTYVQVSNNYILEPLRNMHKMLVGLIERDEMQKAQEELVESCKRASQGIQIMFNEDRAQTTCSMTSLTEKRTSSANAKRSQSVIGLPLSILETKIERRESPSLSPSNADQLDQDLSITVWHGPHCHNCVALKSIDDKNFARLQHHFKYCATYCVYYQLMADIEKQIMSNENIKDEYKKESHIFHSKQAQHLCEISAEYPQAFSSTKSELFKRAATLSEELLGPAETATFNCDRYEEYMRLLLEIARITKADIELIGDIEMYLKPFDHNPIATRSQTNEMNEMKWDETFSDLKHSPEDENFGRDLKEIIEPELGGKSFIIPTEYKAKCHGII